MRRTLVGFVLVTVLTGCVSPLDRLDQRVAKLIGQQQQITLGPDATDDPQPVPARLFAPKPQRDMYRYDPDTTNPTPDQLPATTNPDPGADLAESKADSPAAAAIVMDLEQALGYAIAHSRDYRNRKEDLFLAALDLLVERHLWGPLFFHDVTAEFSGMPEAGDHDQVLTLINELRVTQRLPYGGDLSVSALVAYVSVLQNATGLSPEQSQSSSLALSIRQPLMRGFGKVAREVLIRTERELVYAVRDFERFRRQLLVDIAADYYGLLAQQARIENLKTNVANFELLARRFDALAKAGRAPYFQAESFQQQVLFARNDLFTAERQYDSSLDAFKIRLGMPTRQPLIIAPSEVIVPEPSLDSVAAVVTAFELRLDLQTTADQVDDARR
ncbi:MAG: TolC family protein, partial [Phycisphaeraceae bacterium]